MRVLFEAPKHLGFPDFKKAWFPAMRVCAQDESEVGSYSYCQKYVNDQWITMAGFGNVDRINQQELLDLLCNTLIGKVPLEETWECDHYGP